MQYLLNEQEYKELTSKGNLDDHKLLMKVITVIHELNSMQISDKDRAIKLCDIANDLDAFHQDGNPCHINDCLETVGL